MREALEKRIDDLKAGLEQSAAAHNGLVGRLMEAQLLLSEYEKQKDANCAVDYSLEESREEAIM
ncbi:MAG: hypothetical protein V4506_12555 [Bacteroidota bacterium]